MCVTSRLGVPSRTIKGKFVARPRSTLVGEYFFMMIFLVCLREWNF